MEIYYAKNGYVGGEGHRCSKKTMNIQRIKEDIVSKKGQMTFKFFGGYEL